MSEFLSSIPGIIIVVGLLVLTIGAFLLDRRTSTLDRMPSRQVMQIILSLVIVGAGLYIILSGGYAEDTEKWAFGSVGTILGYWLSSKT